MHVVELERSLRQLHLSGMATVLETRLRQAQADVRLSGRRLADPVRPDGRGVLRDHQIQIEPARSKIQRDGSRERQLRPAMHAGNHQRQRSHQRDAKPPV